VVEIARHRDADRHRRAHRGEHLSHLGAGRHRRDPSRSLRLLPRVRVAGPVPHPRDRLRDVVGRAGAMSKPAFVGRFLAIFALLIFAGWATEAPARYAGLLRTTVAGVSPVLTGWWIETRDDGSGRLQTWFRRGGTGGGEEAQRDRELKLLLSLD